MARVILIGAAATGNAVDTYGRLRVVTIALWVYGGGVHRADLPTAKPLIAYAILMPLMPEEEHGGVTGLYSVSRGVGIIVNPIPAAIAISLTSSGIFSATKGFQVMWIVCAAAPATSLVFVRRLRRVLG